MSDPEFDEEGNRIVVTAAFPQIHDRVGFIFTDQPVKVGFIFRGGERQVGGA